MVGREVEISTSSVSLFDVATCPKLDSIAGLPPSPSGSAGIKESTLGPPSATLLSSSLSRRYFPYYTASQLNLFRSGGSEKGEGKRRQCFRTFQKIKGGQGLEELLFAGLFGPLSELGGLERSFLPSAHRDAFLLFRTLPCNRGTRTTGE